MKSLIISEKKSVIHKKAKLLFDKEFIKELEKITEKQEENLSGIKYYLRYRIINDFCIADTQNGILDCDKLSKEILIKKYNVDNDIYETDTANSVQTLLGFYLRLYYEYIYCDYDYPKVNSFRDYNLLSNIDKFDELKDDEIIKLFDELCSIYHSIGNMILVPKKFNTGRRKLDQKPTNDFIGIGLEFLKSNSYTWKNKKYYQSDEVFNCLTGYNYFKNIKSDMFDNIQLSNPYNNDLLLKKYSKEQVKLEVKRILVTMIDSIRKRNKEFDV